MVDLAVPRDIEPEVKDLRDVYLYTVDDLASVVRTGPGPAARPPSAQAEVIIDARRAKLFALAGAAQPARRRGAAHPAAQPPNRCMARPEIARAKKLLAKGEDVDAVLEALSRGLTQKMLHGSHGRPAPRQRRTSARRPPPPCSACSCAGATAQG